MTNGACSFGQELRSGRLGGATERVRLSELATAFMVRVCALLLEARLTLTFFLGMCSFEFCVSGVVSMYGADMAATLSSARAPCILFPHCALRMLGLQPY